MRNAFLTTLLEIAERDPNVWLVTGDLGYSVLEPFRDRFPDRFANVGVAEQNMIGVAAGLAFAGKHVVTYSIVNFPVMRSLEQIRNDVAYHNLPVTVVVVGGGLVYGAHGYTHHGAEDIGVMRLLPNMSVMVPGDAIETAWATRKLLQINRPSYLRLARGGEPSFHDSPIDESNMATSFLIRNGNDYTIIAAGPIVQLALSANRKLSELGKEGDIFSVPSLVPMQIEEIWESANRTGRLLVLEDHGRGGLGTILAEQYAERAASCQFRSLYYGREPVAVSGRQEYLRSRHGINEETVIHTILAWQSN